MSVRWHADEAAWQIAIDEMLSVVSRGSLAGAEAAAPTSTVSRLWHAGPPGQVTFAGETGDALWAGPLLYIADGLAAVPTGSPFARVVVPGESVWQSADIVIDDQGGGSLEINLGTQRTSTHVVDLIAAIESFRAELRTELTRRHERLGRMLTFRPIGSG